MTIREFLELAIDNCEDVILCNCTENAENIFTGTCYDALNSEAEEIEEALDAEILSWNMEDGVICLNFYLED